MTVEMPVKVCNEVTDDVAQEGHKAYTSSAPTTTDSAWIDPNGVFYAVEFCEHMEFANYMVDHRGLQEQYADAYPTREFYKVEFLEKQGWMHVSAGDVKGQANDSPTKSQVETCFDWYCVLTADSRHNQRITERLKKFIDKAMDLL